jgi:hypothetical protein
MNEIIRMMNDYMKPILQQTRMYKMKPIEHPHNFSPEDIDQLETLHYHLTTALWRLHHGALEEKLKRQEIDIKAYSEEVEKLYELHLPYRSGAKSP